MISKIKLIDIISRRQNGAGPALVRLMLWMVTPIYSAAMFFRNQKYDRANQSVTKVSVPVISIGNLTTGGTGKTPMVIWVCQRLREIDKRVAVISRGYGASRNQAGLNTPNDEALEMQQRLPDVPQLQDPDRIKSATIAIEELETECIVLDDGFQHRKLHRDLDVVLVDATNPFGYGYVLPRGLLREPLHQLVRADIVIITRCEQVNQEQVLSMRETIQSHGKKSLLIGQSETVPTRWIQHDGRSVNLESFGDQPVFACCAIGNPDNFMATARRAGAQIVGSHFFDDHHHFDRQDIERVVEMAKESQATRIICTHKDLVKIAVNQFAGIPIHALQSEVLITDGEDAIKQRLLFAQSSNE